MDIINIFKRQKKESLIPQDQNPAPCYVEGHGHKYFLGNKDGFLLFCHKSNAQNWDFKIPESYFLGNNLLDFHIEKPYE